MHTTDSKDKVDYLATLIRDVVDFPKPGIVFKDITPLLRDPKGLPMSIDLLADAFAGEQIDIVAGIESRGFIFGTGVATRLGAGFVPVRKPGKLPAEKLHIEYELEYGTGTLEMHTDAIEAGQRVLLVDDLLATGGTMRAACELIERLGGTIAGIGCVIELAFLDARSKLGSYDIRTFLTY